MKKHWKWLVPLVLLAAALAGWRWYPRPLTLEQLCPQFPWAQVTHISGLEHVNDINAPAPAISSDTVSLDDSKARAIYDRCLTAKFRRDPITALTNTLRGYSTFFFADDSAPELIFHTPDQIVALSIYDKGNASLTNASLDMALHCGDDALAQDLLTFLRAYRYVEEIGI